MKTLLKVRVFKCRGERYTPLEMEGIEYFLVKSTYRVTNDESYRIVHVRVIYRISCPLMIKIFLWLVAKNSNII